MDRRSGKRRTRQGWRKNGLMTRTIVTDARGRGEMLIRFEPKRRIRTRRSWVEDRRRHIKTIYEKKY